MYSTFMRRLRSVGLFFSILSPRVCRVYSVAIVIRGTPLLKKFFNIRGRRENVRAIPALKVFTGFEQPESSWGRPSAIGAIVVFFQEFLVEGFLQPSARG